MTVLRFNETAKLAPGLVGYNRVTAANLRMLSISLALSALLMFTRFTLAQTSDTELEVQQSGTNQVLRVFGNPEEDWAIESSTNLTSWSTAADLGTLLSERLDAPSRAVTNSAEGTRFFRVRRTSGLYDPTVLRTISLIFTQANWATLLTRGRDTGTNTVGALALDNGATNSAIGARYKGNTSFTMGGAKKSINLEVDWQIPGQELMGYETINLNNAAADETIMREPLYFTVMSAYTVSPKGAMARLFINGANWGVYSLAQQEDSDLVREWFPSNDGDRWRAPNIGGAAGVLTAAAGPPGGGGFSSPLSAFSFQGTNLAVYKRYYELKTDNSTNAWERLYHAIDVLNRTPADQLRDKVQEVLDVDRWLWFTAIENIFTDDDSYWNKGADYAFYYEPESGRFHPIEHDGNEAFTVGDVSLSPVQGSTGTNRPILSKLLSIPDFRQRYLAHMKTVLEEQYNPGYMTVLIEGLQNLSVEAIRLDPKKGYSMSSYSNDVRALKTFVTNRYRFLTNHAELRPLPPRIGEHGTTEPKPLEQTWVQVQVAPTGSEGISSAWIYYRLHNYGRFTAVEMRDDGQTGDGASGDGTYGAVIPAFPAGTRVRYYFEARSANAAQASAFSPARAENEVFEFEVPVGEVAPSVVRINELLAWNQGVVADPQGENDDYIELTNNSDQAIDLAGMYLSDNTENPRKWAFPTDTVIAAHGYLLIWADEDGADSPGLHANFKLANSGETVLLVDRDDRGNALLDSVTFGSQVPDRSYSRTSANPNEFAIVAPTPNRANP